ncbi:alpha-2-macroglobulin-like protein 1, partial [Silurus asotus]
SIYLLAVTSQAVGGTTEMLCVTVNPSEPVSMDVTLEYNQNNVTILTEMSITEQYYNCIPFQVPVVTVDTVASIKIKIKGSKTTLNNKKNFLITPSSHLIIIQTDKPIYKPGQTGPNHFRIFFILFYLIFCLQDPNSNRIGQWLQVKTLNGLVDLSYPINSEATKGFYIITIWDEKNQQITQTFEVKDYVLPTFEVTVQLPPVITILDTTATLKVCAKYTYGKPVSGTVKATVCHKSYKYGMFTSGATTPPDICKTYTIKSDKSGCGLQTLNLAEFALIDSRYEASIVVQCEVEEDGTGVIMTGSGSSSITSNMVTLSFDDSPTIYKPGIAYEGKIKVLGPKSNPMKRKVVYLTISYSNNKKVVRKLVTGDKGIAKFSLNTEPWGLAQLSLQAQYEKTSRPVIKITNQLTPNYPTAYLSLQPFYSKSQSFIKMRTCVTIFSCIKKAVIRAQYLIHQSALAPRQKYITFFYMVMSKGHLYQQGRILQAIKHGKEHKGELTITLQKMLKMSPIAQVVIYMVLPNGQVVADSMNYPIQLCLANKVSLKFSATTELPAHQISMTLNAAPGSLCSVRAIDQSLLLLQPESELNIESVFNMLPLQMLSGYPYNINEEDSFPCWGNPFFGTIPFAELAPRSLTFFPSSGKVDVYNIFKDVGIKIVTNANIKKPSECINNFMFLGAVPMLMTTEASTATTTAASVTTTAASFQQLASSNQPVVTIRKFFPETWIWDLVSVSPSGMLNVDKTTPDSITTWQAGAFCTSSVGFGVAPKTALTVFQPFFVSLNMPSSVIRGEVFSLKVTVFNYITSCMMVKVTLDNSKQFAAKPCKDCVYTKCLCVDENWTFTWTITPLVLGQVSIKVTAEAMQSSLLCGGNAVTVPEKGRIDSVIKMLQVLAEGTKQSKSYNELLCPSDGNAVEKKVSLNLPDVFVSGSAVASVSVLGDLMGRALQNLASLLAMPYGCGEQNMLLFAPDIFILEYLESTNQLTPAIRSTAETFLVSGYQRELTYKHNDGSYSAFGMSDASGNTWLTAFVMKSFGNAKRYIFVDQALVDQAKAWLGQQQQENGCFASVGQLIHTDMKGGVNDEVSLSAYITAAMLDLGYTSTDPVVSKGLECLRNAYTQVNSTYTNALLFYTFTLAGDSAMRNTLISGLDAKAIISGGGRHWSREDGGSVVDSLEVEMTSYVLLALMSGPLISGFDLGYSSSIVYWLSQQQNAFGGFASTQDTVVALQALAKYSLATFSPSGTLTVTVTSPSGQISTFTINQSNRLLYQESQLQELPGDYNIKAEGKGCVYVQFTLSYNIPPPPDGSSFTVSASASGTCNVPNPSLELTITVIYKGQRVETNMVVIKVNLLSGFSVDETSVRLPTNGSVKRVDQTDGEVIIYLNGLTNGDEMVYSLTTVQAFTVENRKPAVVMVYDYYETGDSALTDYTSPC